MRISSSSALFSVAASLLAIVGMSIVESAAQAQAPAGRGGAVRERIIERIRDRAGDRAIAPAAKTDAAKSDAGEPSELGGRKVVIWKPAEAKGPMPLVVFSHGFHGTPTQSKFLTAALAKQGYLVVAPKHADSGFALGGDGSLKPDEKFGEPESWTEKTYRDRGDDVRAIVEALKNDKQWTERIAWEKVALIGHSLGGYTSLGAAGAWPSWKLAEVKAVVALSPYCSPYVKSGTLAKLNVPVMYQGGTRDFGITPFVKRSGGAYDATPSPCVFVEFDGAGHMAWTDLKPDHHDSITRYTLAFLAKHLQHETDPKTTTDLGAKRADVAELRAK